MAIPTRRTSARLSGGSVNDDQGTPLAVELLGNITRKKRNSANGTILGNDAAVSEKQDANDGTRKRQRTADKPVGTRKTKTTMPFKPVPVSSLETAEEEIISNGRPPAPPQSTRRIARQRPSASRMDESPPSPPTVPITSTTTSQPRRGAASSAVQSDVTKTNKGKLAVKPANGNTVASASAEQSDSEGLGAKGSIETEVAAQRKEWEDEADRIRSTVGHSTGLVFNPSEELEPTGARPISPPRAAPNASHFQTPRASRRTKIITIDTVEPIALSETPMQRKNIALRERASSRRGSRMSDAHKDDATSSEPHAGVNPEEYHSHISQTLTQPVRARYLLMWCLKRAMADETEPPKKRGKEGKSSKKETDRSSKPQPSVEMTAEGDEMVALIMQDIFRAQTKGELEANIFASTVTPEDNASIVKLSPNPRNVKNRQTEVLFNRDIARDKAEEAQWVSIFGRVNEHRHQVLQEQKDLVTKQAQPESQGTDDIPSFTGREPGIERLHTWAEMAQEVLSGGDDIEAMPLDDVEYHVDVLHQASHAALQYSATAKRFLDGIFASLAQDVRNRDQSGARTTLDSHGADREVGAPPSIAGFLKSTQAESSSHTSSGLDILKSLSANDDPSKGAEMMRLLDSLPPVPPSVRRSANPGSTRAGSNPTSSASGSMTPRRPGSGVGITPRKIGRLGSSTPRRERAVSRGPSPSSAT